uniref:Uncharacterized protein n=1 Tax=Pyrodinium bahamense TaxID=73915 RepID=A0A7S0FXA4_9DINO|mmetsp:Transcript_54782/g.151953  ORF Transcript_54782/g.151953 Transcript_54782/m.151953 type:complete len:133 (+) Transcript_54782:3-401(+)
MVARLRRAWEPTIGAPAPPPMSGREELQPSLGSGLEPLAQEAVAGSWPVAAAGAPAGAEGASTGAVLLAAEADNDCAKLAEASWPATGCRSEQIDALESGLASIIAENDALELRLSADRSRRSSWPIARGTW